MKKTTKNILTFSVLLILVCSLFAFGVSCTNSNSNQSSQDNEPVFNTSSYALLLDIYQIKNYNSSVSVVDANGESVSVNANGEFLVTTPGRYVITSGEVVSYLYAYAKEPESDFIYSENLNGKQFIAGDTIQIPACDIQNVVKSYEEYNVALSKNGEVVQIFEGGVGSFFVETSGDYKLTYSFVNVFGSTESDEISFNAIDKKRIVYSTPVEENILLGTEVTYNTYGYFAKNKYESSLSVKTPSGKLLNDNKVLFNEYGEYVLTFTSVVNGVNVKEEFKVNTELNKSALFSNAKSINSIQSTKLDEFCLDSTGSPELVGEEALKINASNSSASIYYSSIIDLSNKTYEDSLIEFYVDKNTTGGSIKNIYVTLIDVYNPSITLRLNWMQNPWNAGMSYGRVSANNQVFFWKNGETYDTYYGTVLGCGYTSGAASGSFNCSFDWGQQAVYMSNSMVADLDYEPSCPPSFSWNGFTTGEVYLRIDFIDCTNGSILVKSINGEEIKNVDLSTMRDNNAVCIDKSISTLPQGAKNIAYPLPKVLENKSIELYNVETKLLLGNQDKSHLLQGNSFVPDVAGDYTVIYTAIDSFGKLIEKTLNITINENKTPILISGDFESQTTSFMEYYNLPEYDISGGNGPLTINVSVKQNGVELSKDRNGYLIVEKDSLQVVISAKDYLGVELKKEFSVEVNDDVQIFYHNPLPNYVFAGEKLNFNVTATNYKTGSEMDVSVYINDVKVTNEYVVPNNVDKLRVLFIAKDSVKTKVSDVYEIAVNKTALKSIADYAQTDFTAEKVVLTSGVVYKLNGANSDYSFNLPYQLSAYQFAFKFGFNDGKINASKFVLTLQDSQNPNEVVNVYFTNLNGDVLNVKVNDDIVNYSLKYLVNTYGLNCGSLTNQILYSNKSYRTAELILDINTNTLLDSSGAGVAAIKKYANGEKFNGFTSGAVLCSFKVLGVSANTEFILSNVCNQSFGYRVHSEGLVDNVEPVIALTNTLNKSAKYGEEYTVPATMAYDVLSSVSSVRLEIRKPSGGTKVVQNYLLTKDFTFTIEEFGIYRIILTPYDAIGNNYSTTINLKVDYNQPPEIVVNGNINEKYRVGDTIEIPTYTVTQNSDAGTIDVIVMIRDADGALHEVNGSFLLTKAGNYELVYRATDKYYNVTRVVYTFVVE